MTASDGVDDGTRALRPSATTPELLGWSDDGSEASDAATLGDWFGWVIVELAPDGILVVDEGGRILLANRRLCNLLGYHRDELVGRRVERLMPPCHRAEHLGHRHDYAADPLVRPMGTGRVLFALHATGAEVPVEISLSPVATGEGMRTIAVIRDASAREQRAEDSPLGAAAGAPSAAQQRRIARGVEQAIQHVHSAGLHLTSAVGHSTGGSAAVQLGLDDLDAAVASLQDIALSLPDAPGVADGGSGADDDGST